MEEVRAFIFQEHLATSVTFPYLHMLTSQRSQPSVHYNLKMGVAKGRRSHEHSRILGLKQLQQDAVSLLFLAFALLSSLLASFSGRLSPYAGQDSH